MAFLKLEQNDRWGRPQWKRIGLRCDPSSIAGPYIAVLGGAETYGRHMSSPYAVTLSQMLGCQVMNLGTVHGGLDSLDRTIGLTAYARQAQAIVIECPDPRHSTNAYYHVHRYNNDRVIGVTAAFRAAFRGIDTGSLHYVGHVWKACQTIDPDRTAQMAMDIQLDARQRFTTYVSQFESPVVTVSFDDFCPDTVALRFKPSVRITPVTRSGPICAPPWAGQAAHDRAAQELADILAAHIKKARA